MSPLVRCAPLRSFSQTSSSSSVSGASGFSMCSVNGRANAFGSSKVTSSSRCPKSRRRKALGEPQGFGLRVPSDVEPSPVVEPGGRHHERVLLPAAHRIPQPRRVHLLRQAPAVGEDCPVRAVRRLIEHDDEPRRLDDAGQAAKIQEGHADGHAVRERAVLPEVLHPLQADGFRPGLDVAGLQLLGDVVVVAVLAGPPGAPDAGQVGLAVMRPGGRSGQVRLAVGQTGDAGRRKVDPLRRRPAPATRPSTPPRRGTSSGLSS